VEKITKLSFRGRCLPEESAFRQGTASAVPKPAAIIAASAAEGISANLQGSV
jgi:hypothetical protein